MDGVGPVDTSSTTGCGTPPAAVPSGPVAAGSDTLATRFGPVLLDEDRQIRFRGGLPGFPSIELFQLEPLPGLESELMLLQAVDAPDVGFITLPLPMGMPVPRPGDVAEVARMLDIAPGEMMILAIVTLAAGATGMESPEWHACNPLECLVSVN